MPTAISRDLLIKSYLVANHSDHFARATIKKQITAFNKANPNDKITVYKLLKERFPTLVKYFAGLNPSIPEESLFENNFCKLLSNLNFLGVPRATTPSYTSYDNIVSHKHLGAAYSSRQVFIHTSGLTFSLFISGYYSTFQCCENPELHLTLSEGFASLQEP